MGAKRVGSGIGASKLVDVVLKAMGITSIDTLEDFDPSVPLPCIGANVGKKQAISRTQRNINSAYRKLSNDIKALDRKIEDLESYIVDSHGEEARELISIEHLKKELDMAKKLIALGYLPVEYYAHKGNPRLDNFISGFLATLVNARKQIRAISDKMPDYRAARSIATIYRRNALGTLTTAPGLGTVIRYINGDATKEEQASRYLRTWLPDSAKAVMDEEIAAIKEIQRQELFERAQEEVERQELFEQAQRQKDPALEARSRRDEAIAKPVVKPDEEDDVSYSESYDDEGDSYEPEMALVDDVAGEQDDDFEPDEPDSPVTLDEPGEPDAPLLDTEAINEVETNITAIEKQITDNEYSLKSISRGVAASRRHLASVKRRIADNQKAISEAEEELSSIPQAPDIPADRLPKAIKQQKDISGELDLVSDNETALIGRLDSINSDIDRINMQFPELDLDTNIEGDISEWRQYLDSVLAADITIADPTIREAADSIARFDEHIDSLNEEARKIADDIDSTGDNISSLDDEVSAIDDEIEAHKQKIDDLTRELQVDENIMTCMEEIKKYKQRLEAEHARDGGPRNVKVLALERELATRLFRFRNAIDARNGQVLRDYVQELVNEQADALGWSDEQAEQELARWHNIIDDPTNDDFSADDIASLAGIKERVYKDISKHLMAKRQDKVSYRDELAQVLEQRREELSIKKAEISTNIDHRAQWQEHMDKRFSTLKEHSEEQIQHLETLKAAQHELSSAIDERANIETSLQDLKTRKQVIEDELRKVEEIIHVTTDSMVPTEQQERRQVLLKELASLHDMGNRLKREKTAAKIDLDTLSKREQTTLAVQEELAAGLSAQKSELESLTNPTDDSRTKVTHRRSSRG